MSWFSKLAFWRKQADWSDVSAKAKRLVQSGNVTILHNTPKYVMAHVVGDHGQYICEFKREDPNNPWAITQSSCECPWEQFRWQRTRKWKKLEGRSCSHLLAAFWKSLSTPLEMEEGEEYTHAPGQRTKPLTEQEMFDQNKGQIPGINEQMADQGNIPLERTFTPEEQPPTQQPAEVPTQKDLVMPQPGQNPFAIPKRQEPSPEYQNAMQGLLEHFNLFDVTAPPANPMTTPPAVSVPGGRPPTPTNPVQLPGTFSHTIPVIALKTSNFIVYAADEFETWINEALSGGKAPIVQLVHPVTLEQSGGKIPMPGAQPIDTNRENIPVYNMMDLGYHPELGRRVNQDEVLPNGSVGSPNQTGVYSDVEAGRRGEVLDIEPMMKMIYIHIPLNESGPLHPHFLKGWVDYKSVVPLPNANTPFRRRRV